MKTIKLLTISIILAHSVSCKEAKNQNNKHNQMPRQTIIQVRKSGLEGKKFYVLERGNQGGLILMKFPQYTGDFEMKKYIFTDNMFIDGINIMEPSKWNIQKIYKKQDSIITYIVNMSENNELIDTLHFIYNKKKGILSHRVKKGFNPIVLIDSSKNAQIKVINKYFDD